MIPVVIPNADAIIEDDIGPDLIVRSEGTWRVSRWSPTPREIEVLAAGGFVDLWVNSGRGHPAVQLRAIERDGSEDAL